VVLGEQETQQEGFVIDVEPLFGQYDHPIDDVTIVDVDANDEDNAAIDDVDGATTKKKSQWTKG
jgi:hypothetical protein